MHTCKHDIRYSHHYVKKKVSKLPRIFQFIRYIKSYSSSSNGFKTLNIKHEITQNQYPQKLILLLRLFLNVI